jgi:hypothetical protein
MASCRRHDRGVLGIPPMHRRDALSLAAILLVAVALRIIFFQGLFSIDDFNYARYAAEVWKGRYEMQNVLYWHGVRPFVFVPVSWAFSIFGVSEASAVLWPLAASLITVFLVFLTGRMLHSRRSGVYAATVAAFLPMFVEESTWLKPGAIINVVIALSAFCFVRAEHVAKGRRIFLLLSGMLFAALPWTGDLGFAFACFFPLAVVLYGRNRIESYWPLTAGFAGGICAGLLYQFVATGDALFNFTVGRTILSKEMAPFQPLFFLKLLIRPLASHGGVLYLAVPGAVAAVLHRRRGALLTTAWFAATWLIIEYGSSSLTEYRPLFKMQRYLSVVAVPGSLLAGMGLEEIHRATANSRIGTRTAGAGAVVALVLLALSFGSAISCLERSVHRMKECRTSLHAVRDIVRSYRGRTVYVTHWLWNTRVGFFLGFADDYFPSGYDPYHAVRLESVDRESKNRYVQAVTGEMGPGLLVNDERLLELGLGPRQTGLVGPGEIPEDLTNPPDSWRLIGRFEIDGNSRPALYEIPAER